MEAWQYTIVGEKLEDSLALRDDVPIPDRISLAKDEVLVQVITSAINPVDYKLPESGWIGSFLLDKPAAPGLDFCGRIIATHPSQDVLQEGDLVFGALSKARSNGTLSQYVKVHADEFALLPAEVDPDHAAAVGVAATTAYQSFPSGFLVSGAKIFVNGGSGGVGSWTIQLAKAMGADVMASCSTSKVGLCSQLGADKVLDYQSVDVIADLIRDEIVFDLVIDNVGDSTLYENRNQILHPSGTFVQVGTPAVTVGHIANTACRYASAAMPGARSYHFVTMRSSTKWFAEIGRLMSEGKVKATIDQKYDWQDVRTAFAKLRNGHARGKILISVSECKGK